MLPGFCAAAPDASTAFPRLAKALGTALQERPELRPPILQGMVALILRLRSLREVVPRADGGMDVVLNPAAAASLEAIGTYAKNFLPLLFNLHQAEPAEKRELIQEAIAAYASAAPGDMLAGFFKSVLRQLLEATAQAEGTQVGGQTHAVQSTPARLAALPVLLASPDGAQVGGLNACTA